MRGERGATLIELAMVMVIISIVAFVVGDSLVMGVRAYLTADERVEATEKGRATVERLVREIRNAALVSTATADASTLCFDDMYGRTVSFRYSGTQVLREEWTPPDITACPGGAGTALADGITAFSFGYVNGAGPQAVPDSTTERVRINLVSASGSESVNFETEAYPVNAW